MERQRIFDIWSPRKGRWSRWVKPALFAQLEGRLAAPASAPYRGATGPWATIDVHWAPPPGGTALVIDLVGRLAIDTGLALVQRGYRPIPLLNACTDRDEVIDQKPLLEGLRDGAALLASSALPHDAPPAFLLDRRRQRPELPLLPGYFDNRWWLFPSDVPSAAFLSTHGIAAVTLVCAGAPATDVLDVFEDWRDLTLAHKDPAAGRPARPMVVERSPTAVGRWLLRRADVADMKPRWFRSRRGFGGRIEQPPSGG